MRTPVKNFRISAYAILQVPKTAKIWVLSGGVCPQATAQTAQFLAMGIISGPSRHPKDVPFVSEFWWGMYGFGAISPQKEQISAKFHISYLQKYNFQRHSPGGNTHYCVPRYALCY